MSNATVNEIIKNNPRSAWMDLEALSDQLYGVYQNLLLVQIGIENNGYHEFSEALSPSLMSIDSACKKAEELKNVLKG